MLERAITLVERGWPMVPSRGAVKSPCLAWKRYQIALPSVEDVRAWDARYHPERWGVITGALAGIVVVDFDGELGRELMERWRIKPHVRTGSGGAHLYEIGRASCR